MSAFSEFLAARVLELEQQLVAVRRRECELRKSRDLWRTRALDKSRGAEMRESRDLWRTRALIKSRKESTSGRRARVGL